MYRLFRITFLILLSFFFGTEKLSAQLNLAGEKELATVRLTTKSGEEHAGYLTRITQDSIGIYVPEYAKRQTANFRLNNLERVAIRKKSTFWQGFKRAFIFSETALVVGTMSTVSSDDYFGPGFYILLGNFLLVGPTSVIGGLVGETPQAYIDISNPEEISSLSQTKFTKYQAGNRKVLISPKGISRVEKFSYSNTPNHKKLSLEYKPWLYLRVIGGGISYTNIQDQLTKQFSPYFEKKYKEGTVKVPFNFGMSISPGNRKFEIGYDYTSDMYSKSSFITYKSEYSYSGGFDVYHNFHTLSLLYRPHLFSNAFGNQLQFGLGAAYSLMNIQHEGIILWLEDDNSPTDQYDRWQLLSGARLLGNMDFFLSRNVSIRTSYQFGIYQKMKIPAFSLDEQNISLPAYGFHPMSHSLTFSVQFHL